VQQQIQALDKIMKVPIAERVLHEDDTSSQRGKVSTRSKSPSKLD